LFIENARGHGELILRHLLQTRAGVRPASSSPAGPTVASSR
jgi:hypothetical protein